ncbi:MAG: HEPN domain-containing protein [Novosphingobium sp.]|nr:HEPN domain-containing protein [Novosphingobium sp.]
MLTLTDHLPSTAQDDLTQIITILFAEMEDALALATQKWKRQGRILKIILFGAHAVGVGFQPLPGGRLPKYSILVIVNDDRIVDQSNFGKHADDRLMREHAIAGRLTTPVSLSVRGIQSVHKDLLAGKSFLCDAVQQGLMLYELPGHSLAPPKPRDSVAIREERLAHFEYWFTNATEFLELARIACARGWTNRGVFQFHQATEALYHAGLYVMTGDSPRSHNLTWLRDRCEDFAPALASVWPDETRFERRCFVLLHNAYVKSRYDQRFRVNDDELSWIDRHVEMLHSAISELACRRLGETAGTFPLSH